MTENDDIRSRNPFIELLVSELIEDPDQYRRMFSQEILVGETRQVFMPGNMVIRGPQGAGKSMILNLIRCQVLSNWLTEDARIPEPLNQVPPFFGISINLVRAGFHAFGRRSVSRQRTGGRDEDLDSACAADYLTHYLFREFLHGLEFLVGADGRRTLKWLGIEPEILNRAMPELRLLPAWAGFYANCDDLSGMIAACDYRLNVWRRFLNSSIDEIPADVWESKAEMEEAMHQMGRFIDHLVDRPRKLPLYVVIDQYEVLPDLNLRFGRSLQRIVNTLIKARDPVVFYKIGARTHDWGIELRIWGAESRIEEQRDYSIINLADVLMRTEDYHKIFSGFALDVATKRLRESGYEKISSQAVVDMLGVWNRDAESWLYFPSNSLEEVADKLITEVDANIKAAILRACHDLRGSPLDLRLAEAWAIQQANRGIDARQIVDRMSANPWRHEYWYKERVAVALLQIASKANSQKRYYGWKTIVELAGANISAFLLLCGEVWDTATKNGYDPISGNALPVTIQSDGVFDASRRWRNRDRNEAIGGSHRYDFLSKLGPAINLALIRDNPSLSNPGYSGFSLAEAELGRDDKTKAVRRYLGNAVSWAILEERRHTSRNKSSSTRRKWYLHPLFSPEFVIPATRVKEPLYATPDQVHSWIFDAGRIDFRGTRTIARSAEDQLSLALEEDA
jgi:hypothetical protein